MKKTKKSSIILPFLKGSFHFFAFALLFSMMNTVLNGAIPQIIRVSVDSIIGGKPLPLPESLTEALGLSRLLQSPYQALFTAAAAISVTAVFCGICTYFSRMCTARGSEGFVKSIRDRLFGHIQKLPFAWHVRHQTGEIIQRCTSDVEVIRNFVSNQLLEVFRITFLIFFSMFMMFSMNVKISLIALAFLPVVIGYSGFFYANISKRFRRADEAEGALSSTVQENLTGVRVVRAFGREQYEIDRFDEKNNTFARLWIHLGRLLSAYWGAGDLLTGIQILTIIVVGTVEAVGGNISLGEFLAFVSYNTTLIWPVRSLGRILSEMSKAGVSIDRVAYILHSEEEPVSAAGISPSLAGDIRFDHVSFSYEGGKPVLQDVSFTIPEGGTFAILGGTGSGKSTLTHLLDRLYPLADGCGSITIGGKNIADIPLDHLRRQIGIVLQEPFLFSRTIRENISISRPSSTLEEVRHAARTACVDDAVCGFSEGYDTIIGERGVTLSGGQKQRVAIARMLLEHTPIMIFDDSLSAVDAQTDAKIREQLRKELGNCTVILISHRITTLMQADQILVLQNGKVAGLGSHSELLRNNEIYKEIYEIQMNSRDRELLEKGGEAL